MKVEDAGGILLGRPPEGVPNGRGQAQVPDWCGDWTVCGPLIAQHNLLVYVDARIRATEVTIIHPYPIVHIENFDKHSNKDVATRCAIVLVVIEKIEKERRATSTYVERMSGIKITEIAGGKSFKTCPNPQNPKTNENSNEA